MTKQISELKSPRNVFVLSTYFRDALDIRWDNPALIPENYAFDIAGCNIYRSNDNPEGPYVRLNDTPITALSYRDSLKNIRITERIPTGKITYGTTPTCDYIIQVSNYPIVRPGTIDEHDFNTDVTTVKVIIDGYEVTPIKLDGPEGKIYLDRYKWFDVQTNKWINPILPTKKTVIQIGENIYISPSNFIGQSQGKDSVVEVSYNYISHIVRTNLDKRLYYKVTTVTTDGYESRLEETEPHSVREIERLDYIWKEAIRRNRWILQQAGHRVKLYFRPWFGERCECWEERGRNQARLDCKICYGTGFKSGYLGPIDILIAPPDTEKNLELTDLGLSLNWVISTWTGPTPEINQRDLIIDKDNRRFTIGPVNKKSCRGMILQQHFDISLLDETDIRYEIPVTGLEALHYITEKPNIDDKKEIRGRTKVFEDIIY